MKKFMLFDTHNGDSQLNSRSGQMVEVLRELTEAEADVADVGPMYHIKFPDGLETDAFEDELIDPAKKVSKQKEKMTDKVFLCVPTKNAILSFEPGTGENLTMEDLKMGFNDYLNWYAKEMDSIDLSDETDGGMVLFNDEIDSYREDLRLAIPAVLNEAFGDETLPYIILNGTTEQPVQVKVIIKDGITTGVLADGAVEVEIIDENKDYEDYQALCNYENKLRHNPALKERNYTVAHFGEKTLE